MPRVRSALRGCLAALLLSAALTPAALAQQPRVVVEPESVDFGDVPPDRTSARTVTIANEGNFPIHIRSARATCECTIPSLSARVIDPGESIDVTITFDAARLYGPQTPTVTVVFAEKIPPLVIEGHADVNHGIRFAPDAASNSVSLVSATDTPFRVLSINADETRPASAQARTRHTLEIPATPRDAQFPGADRWAAVLTDDPDAPVVVVPTPGASPDASPRSWTIDQTLRVLGPTAPGEAQTFDVGVSGLRGSTLDALSALHVRTFNAEAGLLGLETTASGTIARFYLRPLDAAEGLAAASITIDAQGSAGRVDAYTGVRRPDAR